MVTVSLAPYAPKQSHAGPIHPHTTDVYSLLPLWFFLPLSIMQDNGVNHLDPARRGTPVHRGEFNRGPAVCAEALYQTSNARSDRHNPILSNTHTQRNLCCAVMAFSPVTRARFSIHSFYTFKAGGLFQKQEARG